MQPGDISLIGNGFSHNTMPVARITALQELSAEQLRLCAIVPAYIWVPETENIKGYWRIESWAIVPADQVSGIKQRLENEKGVYGPRS